MAGSAGLAAAQAAAEPRPLSDLALDRVVAGAVAPAPLKGEQRTTTPPGGPVGGNGSVVGPSDPIIVAHNGGTGGLGGLLPNQPPSAGGGPQDNSDNIALPRSDRRDAIAVDGASAVLDLVDRVDLSGGAQQGLQAGSLVNAVHSDAASVANIADLGAREMRANGVSTISQRNALTQTKQRGGGLGRASLLGQNRYESFSESYATGGAFSRHMQETVISRSQFHSLTRETMNVNIPSFNPVDSFELDIGFGAPDPFVLPGWTFNGTVEIGVGEAKGIFGARATVGETTFGLPGLVLGTVKFEGDDIVIGQGTYTLPSFDFPSVTGEICTGVCFGGDFDIPSVGGQTGSLPIPELRLEGANPFKDFDLQLGQGIAAVGSGSFSFGGMSASLTADLSFELPSLTGQSVDFTVPGLFEGIADDVTVDLPDIELPPIEVSFTMFDFQSGTISESFGFSGTMQDASVCIAITTQDCGSMAFFKEEHRQTVNSRMVTESFESSSYEERSESRVSRTTSAAELREAEAELIALSDGNITVVDHNIVAMSGGAQQGMRALSAANVVQTVTGSALNVTAGRRALGNLSAQQAMRLVQTNAFVQIR